MEKNSTNKMFELMDELYPDLKSGLSQKKSKDKLVLSVTRTWGNRTISTNSSRWRTLKKSVLKRDNYECRFCGIRLSKHMVMDHMDGRADNNDPANFGLNCPLCDKIRHCGLAGVFGDLCIRESNLSQVDIVKKTQEFFKKHGRAPNPLEIDPLSRLPTNFAVKLKTGQTVERFLSPDLGSEYSSIGFANVLMQFDYDFLQDDIRNLKGFFMPKDIFGFLKCELA